MFTDADYIEYFDQLQKGIKDNIVIYTDLMSVVDNKSLLSKLQVLATENAQAFRFIREQKDNFGPTD